jgi:hypothetical protein
VDLCFRSACLYGVQRENLGFVCLRTEKAYVKLLTLLRMAVMVFVIVHIYNSIVQSLSKYHSMTSHISVSYSLTAPPKKVTITAEILLFSLTAVTTVLTHCRFPKLCCAFNLLFPEGRPDIAQEPSEQ